MIEKGDIQNKEVNLFFLKRGPLCLIFLFRYPWRTCRAFKSSFKDGDNFRVIMEALLHPRKT